MFDVYAHNKIDNLITKFFNTRLLILLGTLISPFFIMNSNKISANIDPLILYIIIAIGFLTGIFIFHKSAANTVIPYLAMQMVLFSVFLDKKILSHFGFDLKLYGAVFVLALFVVTYHLIKDIKYFWHNFPLFKFLFIYFIFIGIYLLFHHYSEFRLSNDLLSLKYALSLKVGGAGNAQNSREFGDLSKYVLFIEWLIPIVSTSISLMVFKGLKTVREINNRLIEIIKYSSIILLIHFSLSAIASLLGFNPHFISIGAVNDVDTAYFFPLFLFILIGFKYFLSNIPTNKNTKYLSIILNTTLAYLIIIIIFTGIIYQSGSAMTLGIIVGLSTIFFLTSSLGIELPLVFFKNNKNTDSLKQKSSNTCIKERYTTNQLIKTTLFIAIVGISIAYFIGRMVNTFDSDLISLGMRFDHWKDSYQSWVDSLDVFKLIFGYGLDSLRETVYFASNSSAIEKGIVSPHNMFIFMIYEQGFVSFLYLAGIISTVITSFKYIKDKYQHSNLKIFSIINIAIVAAIFAMWNFADMPMISKITFFCVLGFLESVKFAYITSRE